VSVQPAPETYEERIQIAQDWHVAHTMIGTEEKVPSEIAYPNEVEMRRGLLIPPHMQHRISTKLELDSPKTGEAGKIRQELDHLTIQSACSHKRSLNIVADLLALDDVSDITGHYGTHYLIRCRLGPNFAGAGHGWLQHD
jgi:hypothetical protein